MTHALVFLPPKAAFAPLAAFSGDLRAKVLSYSYFYFRQPLRQEALISPMSDLLCLQIHSKRTLLAARHRAPSLKLLASKIMPQREGYVTRPALVLVSSLMGSIKAPGAPQTKLPASMIKVADINTH